MTRQHELARCQQLLGAKLRIQRVIEAQAVANDVCIVAMTQQHALGDGQKTHSDLSLAVPGWWLIVMQHMRHAGCDDAIQLRKCCILQRIALQQLVKRRAAFIMRPAFGAGQRKRDGLGMVRCACFFAPGHEQELRLAIDKAQDQPG